MQTACNCVGDHESDVGCVVEHHFLHLPRVRIAHTDPPGQISERVEHERHRAMSEGRVHGNAQTWFGDFGTDGFEGFVGNRDAATRVRKELLAPRREPRAARRPLEQRCANRALESGDALAHRGLRAYERARGPAEAAGVGDGEQHPEIS